MAYKMEIIAAMSDADTGFWFYVTEPTKEQDIEIIFERVIPDRKNSDYMFEEIGVMVVPPCPFPKDYWDFNSRDHEYYIIEEPYDVRGVDWYSEESPIWVFNLPVAVYPHWEGSGLTPTSSCLQHKLIL